MFPLHMSANLLGLVAHVSPSYLWVLFWGAVPLFATTYIGGANIGVSSTFCPPRYLYLKGIFSQHPVVPLDFHVFTMTTFWLHALRHAIVRQLERTNLV